MTDEIQQSLGEWVLSVAPEYEREWESHVDDDVEWSIKDAHVGNAGFMEVDGHAALEVEGMTTGRQSRQVRRSTRLNPPEYKNETVDIGIHVVFHFDDLGYADVRVEQFDYPFEPDVPEYEPEEV